jgi:hypothetical protein
MKKITWISLIFLLLTGTTTSVLSDYDLVNIPNLFKEKNITMTEFKNVSMLESGEYDEIEDQRDGDGWRYFTFGDKLRKQVIIYNHGHRGRKQEYEKFATDGPRKGGRDLYGKAQWYFKNGVSFYGALRKETDDLKGIYGRGIEAIEVFHNMTKKVKQLHGEDVDICYVGHSEGGSSVLYSSIFLEGRHVAISPSHNRFSVFKLTGKEFYDSPEYYNRTKNLTVLMGDLEFESPKFEKMFRKAEELDHINTKLLKGFTHPYMVENMFLDETGPEVLDACGFKN